MGFDQKFCHELKESFRPSLNVEGNLSTCCEVLTLVDRRGVFAILDVPVTTLSTSFPIVNYVVNVVTGTPSIVKTSPLSTQVRVYTVWRFLIN